MFTQIHSEPNASVIVTLVSGLAWPVALLLLAWLFRRSIAGLTEKMQSLEAPGVKIVLNQERVAELIRKALKKVPRRIS